MNNVLHLFPEQPAAQASRFEELWKIWPRREKKPLARAKYETIIQRGLRTRTLDKDSGTFVELDLAATEEAILAGAKAYLDSEFDRTTYRYKDGGKFIPYLATWLNGGRWEDWL